MICPKCKSENQFDNFCGECGKQLKEKCPECGKMEPIGRKVCETKLEETEQAQKEYLENKVGNWREALGVLGGIIVCIVGTIGSPIFVKAKFAEYISISWQFVSGLIFFCIIIVLAFLSLMVLGFKRQKQAEQKATQKFLQENPDYAEILRKAEKNKS